MSKLAETVTLPAGMVKLPSDVGTAVSPCRTVSAVSP